MDPQATFTQWLEAMRALDYGRALELQEAYEDWTWDGGFYATIQDGAYAGEEVTQLDTINGEYWRSMCNRPIPVLPLPPSDSDPVTGIEYGDIR